MYYLMYSDARPRLVIGVQMNNKADAIRAVLKELGISARTKEVIQRLKSEGTEVTPQQVSNEKAKHIKQSQQAIHDLPASVLKRVKKLVDELGSIAVVRTALDELDELTGKDSHRS